MRGPLDHLGNATVLTGTGDVLNPDAHRFEQPASNAPGTTAVVHEYPEMIHDRMIMPIPEARAGTSTLTRLLSEHPSATLS